MQTRREFLAAVAAGAPAKAASNWMMGELTRVLKDRGVEIDAAPVAPQLLSQTGLYANTTTLKIDPRNKTFSRCLISSSINDRTTP